MSEIETNGPKRLVPKSPKDLSIFVLYPAEVFDYQSQLCTS